jgi:hypothetical protein
MHERMCVEFYSGGSRLFDVGGTNVGRVTTSGGHWPAGADVECRRRENRGAVAAEGVGLEMGLASFPADYRGPGGAS